MDIIVKGFIMGCTLIVCIIFLSSCGIEVLEESVEKEYDEEINVEMREVYRANTDTVKRLGRTYYSEEDILWCAYSGTGVEFKFTGKRCTINIVGDSVSTSSNKDNYARIGIYVNDKRVVDDMISKKDNEYVVIDESEVRDATIKILKLSETAMSTFGIASIDVEGGTIEPTVKKDLLIEFVGDSITCGYGVDDEDPEHHFSTRTEDVTRAYAYKAAEALNADYSMVSISGYGIISGYTTGDEPITNQRLPQYYEKLGFSYGDFGSEKPQDIHWDFTLRQPDIVVINLGTNDSSYTRGQEDRLALFSQEYGVFIKRIRELNPDATIVCSVGIMGTQVYPSIELAVNGYIAEAGDHNIHLLKFDEQKHEDGFAADWHPTEATHTKAAKKLVDKIYNIHRKLDPSKPTIALTFDDGPNNTTSLQVIELLEKYNIVASFFVIGDKINTNTAETIKKAYDLGCEIGNHSRTHSSMVELSEEDIIAEIEFTSDKIKEITGEAPRFFRPPYIAYNNTMHELINLPFIAGYGAYDWDPSYDAQKRYELIMEQITDGGIILLHDFEGNSLTVDALDLLIPALLDEGYQFVTVSQLFEFKEIEPRKFTVYSNVLQKGLH